MQSLVDAWVLRESGQSDESIRGQRADLLKPRTRWRRGFYGDQGTSRAPEILMLVPAAGDDREMPELTLTL